MNKERLYWVDIAKGIAIILVVIGHTSIPMRLNSFIFAFHVPLFFLAAGITNNFNKPIANFLLSKLRTLLLPFVVYSSIILFMRSFVLEESFGELVFNFLEKGWMGVPLWFVPVLFVALVVVKLTFEITNSYIRHTLWFFLPLISLDLFYYHCQLPWNMSVMPFASALIVIGYICRDFISKHVKSIVGGTLCLLVVAVISQFCRLDMCFNHVLPISLIILNALAGSFMVFSLSYYVQNHLRFISKLLQGIGKETYLILAFAEIIIVYLNYLFDFNLFVKYGIMIVLLYLLSILRKLSRL